MRAKDGSETRTYEVSEFEGNTIKHQVDQAMKEANELVAGAVGGGDLVGGGMGNRAKGKCRKKKCLRSARCWNDACQKLARRRQRGN